MLAGIVDAVTWKSVMVKVCVPAVSARVPSVVKVPDSVLKLQFHRTEAAALRPTEGQR